MLMTMKHMGSMKSAPYEGFRGVCTNLCVGMTDRDELMAVQRREDTSPLDYMVL